METAEIRRRFISYFEKCGHEVVPSASLVSPDPSLLFTVAGMVPFIPYLTGQQKPPFPRAVSVQKCVRTADIEEVGKTTRHGTFFQMNGNFSFGDYFKKDAIRHAWELSTGAVSDGGLGLDADRIWVTALEGDEEAISLWREVAGLPMERIQQRDAADNYWSTGQPGPGGPCSEMYFDRGPEFGPEGGPVVDEDRFLEFWNLVFMQHQLSAVRSKTDFDIEGDLANKNIDTGMGLERVAFLLQNVGNLYESDEVFPVIEKASSLTGVKYGENKEADVHLRVVADHVRSSLMLISDGVVPSNEGRGYVLRRLIRRTLRAMRLLGYDKPCLPELLPVSRDRMKASYPVVDAEFGRIGDAAYGEEESFRRTLASGSTLLASAIDQAKSSGKKQVSGADAFALHDTYGFPIELTLEAAAEHGIDVDREQFTALMTEQRERAKADAKAKKAGSVSVGVYRDVAESMGQAVEFTGYSEVESEGRVVGVIVDGETRTAKAGESMDLVLDRTPFYAESGGQLADHGRITLGNGAVVEVQDVQSPFSGLTVHRATVVDGEVAVGDTAQSVVDPVRRRSIAQAHTGTHLLHKAIRETLGDTATQAGSENAPGRFRFDFHANKAVSKDALAEVEERINTQISQDFAVRTDVMSQDDAMQAGAMALFGEKYGDKVRVVNIGDWSIELCGGTHVSSIGQIGVVSLLGESSIGSGVRRVEAIVGLDAYKSYAREHALVSQLTDALKVQPDDLVGRVETLMAQLKDADKQLAKVRMAALLASSGEIAAQASDVGGVSFVGHDAGEANGDDLRTLVLDIRGKLGAERPSVVAMTAVAKGRPLVVIATNDAARDQGLRAGDMVKIAAKTLGGGGGGKPDVAQGGGQDPSKIDDALAAVKSHVADGR